MMTNDDRYDKNDDEEDNDNDHDDNDDDDDDHSYHQDDARVERKTAGGEEVLLLPWRVSVITTDHTPSPPHRLCLNTI